VVDQQGAVLGIEDERAHGDPVDRLEPVSERLEPALPLRIGNRGVRGRSRRENKEADVAERALLRTKRRPLAKEPAVSLLPDERDRPRSELSSDSVQPLAVEVAPAQVARATCRSSGRVRQSDSELQDLELLLGSEQPRREAGVVQ